MLRTLTLGVRSLTSIPCTQIFHQLVWEDQVLLQFRKPGKIKSQLIIILAIVEWLIIIHYQTTPNHNMPCHSNPRHASKDSTKPYRLTLYHTIPYHTTPHHTIPYDHTTLNHTTVTIPYHNIPQLNSSKHTMLCYIIQGSIARHTTI